MKDILSPCEPRTFAANPADAFQAAIDAGRLSDEVGSPLYAGKYMYMGQQGQVALFKSFDTREYLE